MVLFLWSPLMDPVCCSTINATTPAELYATSLSIYLQRYTNTPMIDLHFSPTTPSFLPPCITYGAIIIILSCGRIFS